MFEIKDYITVAFSAIALFLSIYNFYRSRKDGRAAHIRTIERKRFEFCAILSEVRASLFRGEAALDAVRFEALIARRADIVALVDKQITSVKDSIRSLSTMGEAEMLEAVVDGSPEQLLAVETFLGKMNARKAREAEYQAQTAGMIAGYRQMMRAASLTAT